MKKIILGLCLLFSANFIHAQGLDSVIVERFYKSNAADAAGSVGTLPAGSWTYRIYVDLAPGFEFQAAYAADVLPTGPSVGDHDLLLQTTTSFFNNEDRGAITPNGIGQGFMDDNTVMIDSWFSVGAASSTKMGVLKSEDDGISNVVNSNGILQNNDPLAGIPLTVQDGFYSGVLAPEPVTFVGITPAQQGLLDNTSQLGNTILVTDGSWASLNGSSGPLPSNRVLIAQITTDGTFTYKLNIQVGNGAVTENWVAENAQVGELTHPSLMGTIAPPVPNVPPLVNIVAPANGSSYITGAIVTIDANATDTDGSIDSVQFFVNGTYIGSDLSGPNPYTINWTATPAGTKNLTARAWDNSGSSTLSSAVTITVGNNPPPAVSITSPANGALFTAPAVVAISANATDNTVVDSVQFFVNSVYVGSDVTGPTPFTFNWTSVIGSASLTAKAWDNQGGSTTSAAVNITVLDPNALAYRITTLNSNCGPNLFCLPLTAVDTVEDVIGYDVVLAYDNVKVQPTGVISVSNDLINANWVSTAHSIDAANGLMYISAFFNASAPASAQFQGTGDIFCVQFQKTPNFVVVDTADFSVQTLQESYANGVSQQLADPGQYITFSDTELSGRLRFWWDGSPIAYDQFNPSAHLITNIYGNDVNCANQSVIAVQPDTSGDFVYDTNNGASIEISKNILGTTDVQPVVNGFDAFLTRLVLINDQSFIPTIYQMVAMDVNTDGVVSAGDLSQISQRAVLSLPEFKQDWNYDVNGLPLGPASKDWLFVDQSRINSTAAYQISINYPFPDGQGYYKGMVPQVPFCLQVPSLNIGGCVQISDETYFGILLGDVNGNFATAVPNNMFKQNAGEKVVFDLSKAAISNGFINIPVYAVSESDLKSLDFAMQFNGSKLAFHSVINNTNYMEVLSNYNVADKTLRLTSNSLQNIEKNQSPVTVRFAINASEISASDLMSLQGYLNGERVGVEVLTDKVAAGSLVSIYPNPASNSVNVVSSEDATIQLSDLEGREVIMQSNVYAYQKHEINTSLLANGVYMLKIYGNSSVTIEKVVIKK